MPELPDIEVYLHALTARIKGATLNDARIGNAFFLRTAEPTLAAIMGQQVTALQRVGKRLAFEFSNAHWLVMHLMIAGRLQWQPTPKPLTRRQLAGFDFSTGTLLVTETGTKRRAWLKLFFDRNGLSKEGFPTKVTAFRPGMAVHGRFGQPCPDCGSPVQRIRYAQRETNYCARCQTGGRVLKDRALSRLLKTDWPNRIEQWE